MIGPIARIFDPEGPLSILSNFAEAGFHAGGFYWRSVEHYFQATKYLDPAHQEAIRGCETPAAAKALAWGQLGEFVRTDWEAVRIEQMRVGLAAKFSSVPSARETLGETWPFPIIEDSATDDVWGIGPLGTGQNLLGRLLEELRGEMVGVSGPAVAWRLAERRPHQRASGFGAAEFRIYEVRSLVKSHARIPEHSVFLSESVDSIFMSSLQRRGVNTQAIQGLGRDVLLQDIAAILSRANPSVGFEAMRRHCLDARAVAFDRKYAKYTWDQDARSCVTNWVARFWALLEHHGALGRGRGIVVGAGSGNESALVWKQLGDQVTLTDIGTGLIDNCSREAPAASVVRCDAEDLSSFADGEFAFYCALRAYQSLYFDEGKASQEARRVLRPGGVLIISVSDAYRAENGDLERGEVVERGDVSLTAALAHLMTLARSVRDLGFVNIQFASLGSELLLFAERPAA